MVSIICPSSWQAGDITSSRSSIIEASRRQILRPVRLARSRTSPFHGGNPGSNPVRDAIPFPSLTAVPSLTCFSRRLHGQVLPAFQLPNSALLPRPAFLLAVVVTNDCGIHNVTFKQFDIPRGELGP